MAGAKFPELVDTWTCHICGDERPDAMISVHTRDVSHELDLKPGSAQENVRYCNDRPECIEGAKTFRFFKPPKEEL
jgi:hypothetical protein